MKTLAELQEIERQLEKSLEAVREAMREQINREELNKRGNVLDKILFLSLKSVW